MLHHKELLKLLNDNGIPYVVVGGVAMRIYNSPRVTHDIDLAMRIPEVDKIIDLLYSYSYVLLTEIKQNSASVALNGEEAKNWIESNKAGSASLIAPKKKPDTHSVLLIDLIVTSQIDLLFELGIPFARLAEHARVVELDEFSFKTASAEDMLILKKQRANPDESDKDDIRFLEKYLKGEG